MPIPKESIVGRWAGDRVTLVGDYDDSELYTTATELYRNISEPLVEAWNQFLGDDEFSPKNTTRPSKSPRFLAAQNSRSVNGAEAVASGQRNVNAVVVAAASG